MLLFRIHRCNEGDESSLPLFAVWGDENVGTTTDLDEPDRDRVAVSDAARQSELLGGALPTAVRHDTCHLKRRTDEMATLKKPTWLLQPEQKT